MVFRNRQLPEQLPLLTKDWVEVEHVLDQRQEISADLFDVAFCDQGILISKALLLGFLRVQRGEPIVRKFVHME